MCNILSLSIPTAIFVIQQHLSLVVYIYLIRLWDTKQKVTIFFFLLLCVGYTYTKNEYNHAHYACFTLCSALHNISVDTFFFIISYLVYGSKEAKRKKNKFGAPSYRLIIYYTNLTLCSYVVWVALNKNY